MLPVAPPMSKQPLPAELQRCHWYVKRRGPPVQVPGSAVSDSPIFAVPETVGGAVFTGAPEDATACVGRELAVVCPSAFDAVTTTRSAWSTSAATGVYAFADAPAISAQPEPSPAQRCHW